MNKSLKFLFLSVLFVSTTTFCQKTETQTQNTATTTSATTYSDIPPVGTKVTIVKYSDYQCPACAFYYTFVKQIKQDFGDDVFVINKHFPLNIHPYAQVAARSAEAAKLQGKYDEYHELLFTGQQQWSQGNAESIFIGYARSLEMDIDKFTADMNSADMNRIVISDRREGIEAGVGSTPTFFVNGDKIEANPREYEAFKQIIQGYMD